jgi:DNA-binding NarL/FixJ family response regulator
MLLEKQPDLKVVGEAATIEDAHLLIERERPAIVVLDPGTRVMDSRAVSELKARVSGMRVLLLTALNDTEQHRAALRSGASGVVLKQQAADILVKAVRRVCAGEVWADRGTTARVLQELCDGPQRLDPDGDQARIISLTIRERQIVALVARGCNTSTMANRLCIADKTVRNHLASIYAKLNVCDRLELALFAVKHRLALESDS